MESKFIIPMKKIFFVRAQTNISTGFCKEIQVAKLKSFLKKNIEINTKTHNFANNEFYFFTKEYKNVSKNIPNMSG